MLRIHRQLRVDRVLSPNADPALIDFGEWAKFDVGPRRDPADFFRWAKVRLENTWGERCSPPPSAPPDSKPAKIHCTSADLREDYFHRPGGMPYVPWRPGTDAFYPPLRPTSSYPPPRAQWYDPNSSG